jgi:hypothetical protein
LKPTTERVMRRELSIGVVARWLPRQRTASAAAPAHAVSFEIGLHPCIGRPGLQARVLRQFGATHGGDAQRLRQVLQGQGVTRAGLSS